MNNDGHRQLMKLGRREFLATAACGAAASVAAPFGFASKRQAQATWTMRQSTSSIHYTHLPIEKACAHIAKLGFEGINIYMAVMYVLK